MERSQIYKDARNQRNSEVHMAILDTKYKLINDVCAFVMGELSVDSLLSTTAKLIEKPVTVPTGIGFSAFIQALKAVTALQARARAHAVQLQYRELIGAIRLYAAARSRRDAAISCFRFADLRDPPSASVPQVSPAAVSGGDCCFLSAVVVVFSALAGTARLVRPRCSQFHRWMGQRSSVARHSRPCRLSAAADYISVTFSLRGYKHVDCWSGCGRFLSIRLSKCIPLTETSCTAVEARLPADFRRSIP